MTDLISYRIDLHCWHQKVIITFTHILEMIHVKQFVLYQCYQKRIKEDGLFNIFIKLL